jgi:transposase
MDIIANPSDLVVGGVDTHKDVNVAAALNHIGAVLETRSFSTDARGHRDLIAWFLRFGRVTQIGIEGTGSYGAGLAAYCRRKGIAVVEVNRPNRQLRRLRGKSDPIDAIAAGRAVLSGEARCIPKQRDGGVESIRALQAARNTAIKAAVQTENTMRCLIVSAPSSLRSLLIHLPFERQLSLASRFRPGNVIDPLEATKFALRSCARRHLSLMEEVAVFDRQIEDLVGQVAPPELMAMCGVGTQVAAKLLVAVGDNPDRMTSEAQFAALCGVSPMDCSSGKHQRHRLNRGGNRDANSALWRIAFTRRIHDPQTRAYIERRKQQGKTDREITRCLKRYIARSVFKVLQMHHQRQEPVIPEVLIA